MCRGFESHLVALFSFSMERGVQVSCIALFIYVGLRVLMRCMTVSERLCAFMDEYS